MPSGHPVALSQCRARVFVLKAVVLSGAVFAVAFAHAEQRKCPAADREALLVAGALWEAKTELADGATRCVIVAIGSREPLDPSRAVMFRVKKLVRRAHYSGKPSHEMSGRSTRADWGARLLRACSERANNQKFSLRALVRS
jgi:hypothetical protein